MRSERLKLDNGRGQQLAAVFDRPLRSDPRGIALFAHCFTCSKNLHVSTSLSKSLVVRGWAVLRFDFTGLGDSEGSFKDTHFSSNIDDLVAVGSWLHQHYGGPQLLIGHSLGGSAVIRAAHQLDSVQAVATLGAPSHPDHIGHLIAEQRDMIEAKGQATVTLGGRKFTITKEFFDDIGEHPMQMAIRELKRALLILHSPRDQVVGIEHATKIFVAARHPKSFVSLDHADHLLTDPNDVRFAAHMIATWAEHYLPQPKNNAIDNDSTEPTSEHSAIAWGPQQGFVTELSVGDHELISDEPARLGGSNLGPSPYEYLLSGLGACTVMTLRMYADRKQWPLEQAICHLKHRQVRAKDCDDCGEHEENTKVDRIERNIELRGPLSEQQRKRLLEIANRCPVHRSLTEHPVVVVTRAIDASP